MHLKQILAFVALLPVITAAPIVEERDGLYCMNTILGRAVDCGPLLDARSEMYAVCVLGKRAGDIADCGPILEERSKLYANCALSKRSGEAAPCGPMEKRGELYNTCGLVGRGVETIPCPPKE